MLIFILLVILSYFILKPFLITIFLGALFAYLFFPLYKKLNSRLNGTFSALLICVLVILIILIPLSFIVNTLIQESYLLFVLVKQKLAIGFFSNCENSLCQSIQTFSQDPNIAFHVQENTKLFTNWVVKKGSDFLVAVPQAIINIFVMLFTMFYFLKEGDVITKKIHLYLSVQKKEYTYILTRLKEIIHGFVFGYFIIALLQGVAGALGLFLFGITSPVFWGVVIFFLALVPFIGPAVIWFPASLFLLLDGIFQDSNSQIIKGIGLFLYGFIILSGIDNIIRPKIIGGSAKIHSVVALLGILGGIYFFGMIGVIIGPLVLSLTIEIIEIYFNRGKLKKSY